ncbi:MAG TPA: hypothetical protein PLA01_09225, partial [Acetivibrio sp.]|nr:hypothetical protein [Acetivibrio sp.]
MKLIVHNIKMSLDDGMDELKEFAIKKAGVKENNVNDFKIVKESIDARKKPHIHIVYSVMLQVQNGTRIRKD